jgi:hypothetical protein
MISLSTARLQSAGIELGTVWAVPGADGGVLVVVVDDDVVVDDEVDEVVVDDEVVVEDEVVVVVEDVVVVVVDDVVVVGGLGSGCVTARSKWDVPNQMPLACTRS